MTFKFSFIRWLYIRRKNMVELITWISIALLLITGHVYTAFALLFLLSLVMIKPIFPDILRIAKNTYVIKFYNIFIWFLAYALSLKFLSYQTGIMEENLKYSPAIMAIPLSLTLVFCIAMIFSMAMLIALQILSHFSIFMTRTIKDKIVKSKFYLLSTRFLYVIPLLLPFIMLTTFISGPFFKIALLADSSFISDCGEKRKDKMYLRIDSNTCMVSTININFFNSSPEIIKSQKK